MHISELPKVVNELFSFSRFLLFGSCRLAAGPTLRDEDLSGPSIVVNELFPFLFGNITERALGGPPCERRANDLAAISSAGKTIAA
jgi:hypothetical protein